MNYKMFQYICPSFALMTAALQVFVKLDDHVHQHDLALL